MFEPRNQWHTFWNAGDAPCEIIEIISPAGFENVFCELVEVYATGSEPDLSRFADLCWTSRARDGNRSVPGLREHFGLTHPLA